MRYKGHIIQIVGCNFQIVGCNFHLSPPAKWPTKTLYTVEVIGNKYKKRCTFSLFHVLCNWKKHSSRKAQRGSYPDKT
jgi:hypothetical protein